MAELDYPSYVGGHNIEEGFGIAVDASGNIYVTGEIRFDQLLKKESNTTDV